MSASTTAQLEIIVAHSAGTCFVSVEDFEWRPPKKERGAGESDREPSADGGEGSGSS